MDNLGWSGQEDPLTASFMTASVRQTLEPKPLQDVQIEEQQSQSKIQVIEPEKQGEGMNSYITYKVKSSVVVTRRYGDFSALHGIFRQLYPQCIIPPLPSKQRMEYLDRFSDEFVERRRLALERFLCRCQDHVTLGGSEALKKFLTLDTFSQQFTSQITSEDGTVLGNVQEYLVNAFAKIKKPEDQFVAMVKDTDTWLEGMTSLEKTFTKMVKLQSELSQEYSVFGQVLDELSGEDVPVQCTSNEMKKLLKENSKLPHLLSDQLQDSAYLQDINTLQLIREQIGFGEAVKDLLKIRDSKQVDFETLGDYLDDLRVQKSRLNGANVGGSSLGSFLKDKVSEMKGSSPAQIKADRLIKLEAKIKDLEKAVDQANQVSVAFNKQVVIEYQRWREQVRCSLVENMLKKHMAMWAMRVKAK